MHESIVENIDCMVGMARYPDKYFDLAIVDPPYGIGEDGGKTDSRRRPTKKWASPSKGKYKNGGWDKVTPDAPYFNELRRISVNQIIWGANHFGNQEPSSGWVVWYKKRLDEVNDFSDAELAFTSFNKGCRLFHYPWIGFGAINAGEERLHPTQKPVALYKWLLKNYAKEGDKILDTHLGSGSSRIAAYDMGFDFTGFEIDKEYFEASEKRFQEFKSQLKIFV